MLVANAQFIKPEAILKQIGLLPGMQTADLGCGSGYFALPAAHIAGPRGRVFAVDVQPAVLEQVKSEARLRNLNNLETVWSDIEVVGAAKIPPASLDMVFLVNTLFQVKSQDQVLAEAKRLLKPGGALLVVDWLPGDSVLGPPLAKRLDLIKTRQMIAGAGFTEQASVDTGPHHFGWLWRLKP